MTREECKARLEKAAQIRETTGLQSASLFYHDAITGQVECREVFAYEYLEVLNWIEVTIANLSRPIRGEKPSYAGYINNGCPYQRGNLFPQQ